MTSPVIPTTLAGGPVGFAARRTPTGRLGQGELRRQVAAHLAATSGAYTPGQVARALGNRSSGAVANALETLAASGHAARVSTKPRRFTATATTPDAARGASPPRPGPPPTTASTPPSGRPATSTAAPATAASTPTAKPAHEMTTAGGRSTEADGGGTVRRRNGHVYLPRVLADLADVEALRRLRKAQIPALLYGPPGTGKTSLVEAAFYDLITVAGDGDTAVADFVGEYTQTEAGAYEFVYGPLVTAMSEGRCLFIDDATLISPKVLAVVYPAMKAPEFVITEIPVAGTRLRAGSWTGPGARVRVGLSMSTRCCRPMGDIWLSPRVSVSALSISIRARWSLRWLVSAIGA